MRPAFLALLLAACLPAYDNGFHPGDGGGGDTTGGGGSGKFVTGTAFDVEDLKTAAGISVSITGFPSFSATTDNTGHYKFEIASAVEGMSSYLVLDGMYQSQPILKTLYLPRRVFDGGAQNTGIANHYFKNPSLSGSAAALVAQALAGHSDISSAATFTDDFSFMAGGLYQYTSAALRIYRNYTVQLSVNGQTLDNTNCKPAAQCCYYYSDSAFNIDFNATMSGGGLVIVCPASQTDEVLVHQTADKSTIFEPVLGMHPSGTIPDISLPIAPSAGVFIDWNPQ
jgi:hypothetical protein